MGNGYVEVEKMPIDEEKRNKNKEKAKFWRSNIMVLGLTLIGAATFAATGGNFFESFAGFAAVPSVPLLIYDIKYLLDRKKNKIIESEKNRGK